jgi:outer membrane lipoprotein-sorting protein
MFGRLALALGLLLSGSGLGYAQTVDDIVAKTIAAQGLEKMKSVQTMRMTGTMTITPPGIDAAIVVENKRPMKTRVTITVQGIENAQAYDGTAGWSFMPVQGKAAAEPATSDEMKDLRQQSDMDGTLMDYKAKGHKVELLGKEAVEGTDAWKLKVTLKDGDVQYTYVDAEHFLPIKMETTRIINGTEMKTETMIGDYKDESGVMMPHAIEARVPGIGVTQKIAVQKVEMNVAIDDARFKMPAPAK